MLDCKGLACPQPVMRTKDLLEKQAPENVEVLVDNQAAGQNVQRFLQSQGYEAEIAAQGGDFVISGRRDPRPGPYRPRRRRSTPALPRTRAFWCSCARTPWAIPTTSWARA